MGSGDFAILDERFRPLVKVTARLEKLYEGCRWAEGPAYFPAQRSLVWSDIPNDRMLRCDEATGAVGVFRAPGRLHQRQHRRPPGPARLAASTAAGASPAPSTTARSPCSPTATRASGSTARTTSSCKSDGSIWFTDPAYGIDSDYEGHKAESEIGACHVYRVDPAAGDGARSSPTISCARTASPSRRTSGCSTSPTPAPRM